VQLKTFLMEAIANHGDSQPVKRARRGTLAIVDENRWFGDDSGDQPTRDSFGSKSVSRLQDRQPEPDAFKQKVLNYVNESHTESLTPLVADFSALCA
jgi:hypothetical protein